MKNHINSLIRIILLGCIIPIVLSTMVYLGFATNYTQVKLFTKEGFESQYNNGIYKYRVLGKAILSLTYDVVMQQDGVPAIPSRSLNFLDKGGDPKFYSAYFYMNTFFLCLTSIVLFFVFGGHKNADFMMVDLPLFFMCVLMTITQYVVVPYDTLSYFLLSLAVLLIIYGNLSSWSTLALCLVVILSTLTRETASLILAFYVAVNHKAIFVKPISFKFNQNQIQLLISIFCFVSTYMWLRTFLGFDHALYQSILILYNSNSPFSLLGVLFFASVTILVLITRVVTKELLILYAASLPYIVFAVIFADLWEIRLWIPILLLVIILKGRAIQMNNKGAFRHLESELGHHRV